MPDDGIAELPIVEGLIGRRCHDDGPVAKPHELPAELIKHGLGPAERGQADIGKEAKRERHVREDYPQGSAQNPHAADYQSAAPRSPVTP